MPPKKEPKGPAVEVPGEDPGKLLASYQKYCRCGKAPNMIEPLITDRLVGLPPHPSVVRTLGDTERYPVQQLVVDDEQGLLNPGGCRALMTTLLGVGPGMKEGPFRPLKSLRLWHSNIGDDGAASVVRFESHASYVNDP